MVTMRAPFTCATGTRQLFTSMPSRRTEHEPHSPSPHPSFTPVNPRSYRSTSSNLSMGWTSNFCALALTVNEICRLVSSADEGFTLSLASKRRHHAQKFLRAELRRDLRAAAEWN